MWEVTLEPSKAHVPAGKYLTKLQSVEPSETKLGSAARWRFEGLSGDQKGIVIQHTTADKPTPKNNLMRLMSGMLGKQLEPGKAIDLTGFVGKEFICLVEQTPEGKTRLASAVPSPKV